MGHDVRANFSIRDAWRFRAVLHHVQTRREQLDGCEWKVLQLDDTEPINLVVVGRGF